MAMSTYQVVEKFVSINGEGRRAGELAAFIRFKGCNLQCSYCDTSWANEPGCESERLTEEEILSWIRETGVKKCDTYRRGTTFTERHGGADRGNPGGSIPAGGD